ncbi:polysaccharide deacetylase family protein [uncultured Rhodoblastus sp.]|uniref:polysaccharide deacetylase family protein n=1 Tax=uncultured Rhodoblastus sp. TaxID=543037 RepID=UPI0025D1FB47|nr:polysaccharide deacetylase family protein [uncultured Rhodoblastus sp.]
MLARKTLISAGLGLCRATGLHRLAGGALRGRGAILTFHRVRPAENRLFAPNAQLEITPEFLDRVLTRLHANGFEIVSLNEAAARLIEDDRLRAPFAALTFDDGFRDVVVHGLPVLERHEAPFTCYVAPAYADRTARLWWVELEEAVRRLDRIELDFDGARLSLPARSDAEKCAAFARLYRLWRRGGNERLLRQIARLREHAGIDWRELVDELCLDWIELLALAAHPLATIGSHTLTHPRLALLAEADALAEMAQGRDRLELELGRPCRHFAYPYGDARSAGPREFDYAGRLGFATAVTTRPGMIFPDHAAHPRALPRLSVNGLWQDAASFDALLSGAPFAFWNRGRRLDID